MALFSADAAIEALRLECNAIALASEVWPELQPPHPSTYEDRGDNDCGCGDQRVPCKALSSQLEAPSPVAK